MKITIHDHAFKHGLTAEQIISAYETGSDTGIIRSRDKDSEPPRIATIGFDCEGRMIEIVFVKTDAERVLIFHANYLTKGFRKEYSDGIRDGQW